MIRLFVRHPVTNFDKWKEAYEAFAEERTAMGVQADAVFQSADNPNDVTAWHDFETLEAARAFAESPRLREAMAKSGLAGEPSVWFTNPL